MLKPLLIIATLIAVLSGCASKAHEEPKVVDQQRLITYTAIRLFVNGNLANVAPTIIKGVTFVPVRAAGEMLNKYVFWDAATKTVFINDQNQ